MSIAQRQRRMAAKTFFVDPSLGDVRADVPGGDHSAYENPIIDWGPSLTRQSEKDACDINFIMKRYKESGAIPIFQYEKQGTYGDVTDVPDYQEAMNRIAYAEQFFAQLPGSMRERFGYSAVALLDFVSNPANDAEAIALGLKPAPATPAPPTAATPPVPPAPSTGSGTPPGA